jgi:hypothetical protein
MQPLKIRLPGDFYDSQIYDKYLHLWCMDGSILTLDWQKLIDKIKIQVDQKLESTLQLILEDGKDLYSNHLMKNTEIHNLIKEQLQALSQCRLIGLTEKDIKNCESKQRDNQFPFPHSDVVVHDKNFYVASQEGIWIKTPRNEKPEILLDTPAFSIDISNLRLAIASGDEGLFYHRLQNDDFRNEPSQLSREDCNLTRWLYPNIFMSSYTNMGSLANFERLKQEEKKKLKSERYNLPKGSSQGTTLAVLDRPPQESNSQQNSSVDEIKFLGMIPSREIFNMSTLELESKQSKVQFVWGGEDKIYWAKEKVIEVMNYTSKKQKSLGRIPIENLTNEIISADSSYFGVVLEMDESLLVIDSLSQSHFIQNEPVNWRVFPKSINYINHLHIIYEDYMDIYIFTHDYFVNQKDKKLGISFSNSILG